jgi:hypothetical protein
LRWNSMVILYSSFALGLLVCSCCELTVIYVLVSTISFIRLQTFQPWTFSHKIWYNP